MGSHIKSGTAFCGKPVCVVHVHCPKEAKTEAPKVLRKMKISLDSDGKYLLGFRRISEVDILVQKKPCGFLQFHGRSASLHRETLMSVSSLHRETLMSAFSLQQAPMLTGYQALQRYTVLVLTVCIEMGKTWCQTVRMTDYPPAMVERASGMEG